MLWFLRSNFSVHFSAIHVSGNTVMFANVFSPLQGGVTETLYTSSPKPSVSSILVILSPAWTFGSLLAKVSWKQILEMREGLFAEHHCTGGLLLRSILEVLPTSFHALPESTVAAFVHTSFESVSRLLVLN